MTSRVASARLVLRSLAAFPAVLVMIAAVTVGLALVATTLPRAVDGVVSNIVRFDVADASPLNRDLIAQGVGAYDLGASASGTHDGMTDEAAAVWGRLDGQLAVFRDALPQPLRGVLAEADFTAATAPILTSGSGLLPADIGLRYDPRYLSRITVTEGREPAGGPAVVGAGQPIEVIASESASAQIEWEVGETRTLPLDLRDEEIRQDVLLVGLFTANDPDAVYWTQATATQRPVVMSKSVPPAVVVNVFADPAGYPAIAQAQALLPVTSSVWFSSRADDVSAVTATTIATQIRQLATTDHLLEGSVKPHLVFASRLPELLEDSLARSAATQAVLATIIVSPIGLAVALQVLVARLAAERLRPSLALLAARGASRRQRLTLAALPVLLIGAASAAVGLLLGLALPGGDFGSAGAVAVALVAVAPAVLLGAFTLRGAPKAAPGRLARILRLAAEALVVLATAAAVVASVQREDDSAVDLLAAAVPLLLSLVGCIVALRVYPAVVRGWLDRSTRDRGIGAFVGLARAVRGGTAGLVPLVAVIIGVSVAVFSGLLSSTLTTGLSTAAHASVGADVSIDNVRLDADALDGLRALDGVEAVAGTTTGTTQKLDFEGRDRMTVAVVLVDAGELAAVQRDVPGRVPLDDALGGPSTSAAPVMVSAEVSEALGGATTGELGERPVAVVGAPVGGEHLGLSGKFLIVDRASAEAIPFTAPGISSLVLVRVAPGASIPEVVDALRGAVPEAAVLTTAAGQRALLGQNPTIADVHVAALLAIAGAALVTSVALVLTLVLEGPARRGTVALLSAVGLSRRQGASVVRWELAPLAVAGLLGGALLGVALSFVVMLIVDLRPFTGGYEQPALAMDPLLAGATVALFAAVFAATSALAARAATRRSSSAPDRGTTR